MIAVAAVAAVTAVAVIGLAVVLIVVVVVVVVVVVEDVVAVVVVATYVCSQYYGTLTHKACAMPHLTMQFIHSPMTPMISIIFMIRMILTIP